MPTIRLKPNSPEFDHGENKQHATTPCDMPHCGEHGEFRAPRDRSLSDHHNFCKAHITDYNRTWNFFEGMNPAEVENHVTSAFYGDRPTWKYREFTTMEETLFTRVNETYGEKESQHNDARTHREQCQQDFIDRHSPEMEALTIMGLTPPVTLAEIKKEYKVLAKRFHPDYNRDDPESEEVLKKINMAYTIIKAAYGKYEHIMAKKS